MSTAVEKYTRIIAKILASRCKECIKNKVVENYVILANAVIADEKHHHYKGWCPRIIINAHGFVEVEHVIDNGIPFLDSVQAARQELIDIANISGEEFEIPYDTITDQLPSAEEIDISFK